MATLTGRTARSTLPSCDTPRRANLRPARPDGLSRAEITRAVPPASRRARCQREALRAGLACPDLAVVRADFRGHLEQYWRFCCLHMSWGGEGKPPRGTTQPTRARLCKALGCSVSTVKACRQWWQARGFLAIVRDGWTPMLGPMALSSSGDHNLRQVLVLCVPRRKSLLPADTSGRLVTRPLTVPRSGSGITPARTREGKPGSSGQLDRPSTWPLKNITDGWWAHLTSPFLAAGWSAADLTFAIEGCR